MPCLIILLILGMPRVALALLYFFGDNYLGRAVPGFLWLIMGFFFLPVTTLAFAYAHNSIVPVGSVSDFGWMLVAVGLLIDLGFFSGGWRARKRG